MMRRGREVCVCGGGGSVLKKKISGRRKERKKKRVGHHEIKTEIKSLKSRISSYIEEEFFQSILVV